MSSSSTTNKPPPRVLQPKKKRIKQQHPLFHNLFGSNRRVRRHSNNISQSLQEAEESERQHEHENNDVELPAASPSHDDSSASAMLEQATGLPVVNAAAASSSSWSSTPADVPYMNAGSGHGSSNLQHTIPAPHNLVANMQQQQQQANNINLHASLRPSMSSSDDWQHFSQSRIETFPAEMEGGSTKRILHIRRTRLQQFGDELKDLTRDLLEYGRAKTWKKKILAVTLCCCAMLVFYDLLFGKFILQWLHAFMVWMTSNVTYAVLAFVCIFVVATLIFIPPTLLVFGAGYAFTVALDSIWQGILAATISCFLGSALGAVIAFLRARYMMRDLVYLFSKRYPLVRVADRCLKTNGFRIMVLLRMCPLLPFNGLNYVCGITGVSLQDFCTSLIGILPFYVYTIILGASAGVLRIEHLKNPNAEHNKRQGVAWIVLIVTGVVFGLIAMVYTWRLVKAELKKELSLTSEEFETLVHGGSIETTIRSSSNRVTTILQFDPEGGVSDDGDDDDAEVPVQSERSVPRSNYYLQDTGSGENDTGDNVETKLMEDGEEWFWVWA